MLLLERYAEVIAAGVTVQAEGSGIVGNGINFWVDQDRRDGEVVEKLSDDGFHSWVNLTPCFRRAFTGRSRVDMLVMNFR